MASSWLMRLFVFSFAWICACRVRGLDAMMNETFPHGADLFDKRNWRSFQSYSFNPNTGKFSTGGEFFNFAKVEDGNKLVIVDRAATLGGCLRHFTFYLHIRGYDWISAEITKQDSDWRLASDTYRGNLDKYYVIIELDGEEVVNRPLVDWHEGNRVDRYFHDDMCYSKSLILSIKHTVAEVYPLGPWRGLECIHANVKCPKHQKAYFTADIVERISNYSTKSEREDGKAEKEKIDECIDENIDFDLREGTNVLFDVNRESHHTHHFEIVALRLVLPEQVAPDLSITITFDKALTPQVADIPLDVFCGLHHKYGHRAGDLHGWYAFPEDKGNRIGLCYSYIPMPFNGHTHISIFAKKVSSVRAYWRICEVPRGSGTDSNAVMVDHSRLSHFHAKVSRSTSESFCTGWDSHHNVLDLDHGSGRFLGVFLKFDLAKGTQEGDHIIAVDRTSMPQLTNSGMEDLFGLYYQFYTGSGGKLYQNSGYLSREYSTTNTSFRGHAYKFFNEDHITYRDGIHYWIRGAEGGPIPLCETYFKDYQSLALFYHDPKGRLVSLDTLHIVNTSGNSTYILESTYHESPDRTGTSILIHEFVESTCHEISTNSISTFLEKHAVTERQERHRLMLRRSFDRSAYKTTQAVDVTVNEFNLRRWTGWAYVNSYEKLGMDDYIFEVDKVVASDGNNSTKFCFCTPQGYEWTVAKYELFYVHH